MLTSNIALKSIILSLVIFLIAWYDTANSHILSHVINDWILLHVYVPTDVTGSLQFHESLLSITALGSDTLFLIILLGIFADLFFKREYKMLIYILLTIFSTLVIAYMCKEFIYSPRPQLPGEILEEYDSFPSGHTVRVSIWCGVLLLLAQARVYYLSYTWRVFLIIIPLLVGYSRLGLGRHWLTDVIGSYALCLGMFALACYFTRGTSLGKSN